MTKLFPTTETYSLTDQMRRAAVSITSNIAEGFGRKAVKEKIQFYHLSLGSTTELHNQCMLARDLGYVNTDYYEKIEQRIIVVYKLIWASIRSFKQFSNHSKL